VLYFSNLFLECLTKGSANKGTSILCNKDTSRIQESEIPITIVTMLLEDSNDTLIILIYSRFYFIIIIKIFIINN
jgi:hypothetical protein